MPSFAQQIIELDFQLPSAYTLESALPHLLNDLGSPDASARSDALSIFDYWISNSYFSTDQNVVLVEKTLEGMRYKLGNSGDDSVFMRSYSALLMLELLHSNLEKTIFDGAKLELIYNAVTDAFLGEQDYRAVVASKGWAYAIPHIGDNFFQLSQTKGLGHYHEEILETIGTKLRTTGAHIFRFFEDERLATIVVDILKQETVTAEFFESWIEALTTLQGVEAIYRTIVELPDDQHAAYCNVRGFLRSLYLQLTFRDNPPKNAEFGTRIEDGLRALDPGFYGDFTG